MGSLLRENVSLWVQTSGATNYPTLPDRLKVDVAVIGGGIAGLTTAYLLKRAGAMVAVLDADRICSGATAYTTAKLTSLHGLTYATLASRRGEECARLYGQANEAAIELVAALVSEHKIACNFERQPAFTYCLDPDRVPDIEAEVQAAQRAGLPASYTEETDLPYKIMAAVRFENQAMFHPRQYCLALAERIPGDASHVFERTRALDVFQDSPCTVMTDRGKLHADFVVVATQLPFLDRGGFFAKTFPERSYALAATLAGKVPDGMYLSADSPTRSVRSAQRGQYVILGGENHKVGEDPDTRRRYATLEQWARQHFDVQTIDYRWSAQDYMPLDDVPYIGRMPRASDHLLVATGFKKWGMSTGTLAGLVLTDMILGRDNPWASCFDSARLCVRHSTHKFVAQNIDVAKHFVGDRLAAGKPPASLKGGEGAIVEIDRKKVAAYRAPDGQLHTLSAACTHMGCLVAWNSAEKSWDCPCHGSRFDYAGNVLNGPAISALKVKSAVHK